MRTDEYTTKLTGAFLQLVDATKIKTSFNIFQLDFIES
jgi:hypothetical protein